MAAVAAVTVIGALLRFWTLGDQSFNHDEAVTAARVLHGDFLSAMGVVVNGERSPPLYYALAWPWSRLFGTGAVGLRSLSALAGTATIPFAYLAARELVSKRAGLVAAVLVALNPYLIWYSQEARSYALLACFSAAALWLFTRALRAPTRRVLTLWAIASALALCTHYFAVFVIVPEALLLLARHGPRRGVLAAIVAIGCVGVALLPLAIVQEGSGRSNNFSQYPVAQRAATAIVKYVASEGPAPQGGLPSTSPFQRETGIVGVALFAVAIALGLVTGSRRERAGLLAAGAVGAAAFVLPLVLAWAGADYVDPRNMISALVPALVAAGIGLAAVRAARIGTAATVAACVLFAVVLRTVATTPALQRHDWRAGVQALGPGRGAQLYVVPADGRSPVEYYTGERLPKFVGHSFVGGIATRTIVVLSDAPDVRSPAPGFRLASTRTAPQHWTVDTYASKRPRPVSTAELRRRNVMPLEPWTALADGPRRLRVLEARVDHGQAIEASRDTGGRPRLTVRFTRPSSSSATIGPMRPSPERAPIALRLIGLLLAATALASFAAAASGASHPISAARTDADGVPAFGHVFLIVGENTSASQIKANHAPYLVHGLKPDAAWLTNYHSLRHRTSSLGDYIGMTSGQFTRCEANDALPIHCHQGVDNLFSQLDSTGVGWRLWAQSMTNACDIFDHGSDWSRNVYSAHHNAAIYYTRIEGGKYDEALKPSAECRHKDLPMGTTGPNNASGLNRALRSGHGLGRFDMIVPNDCADGHDPCGQNRIRQFDDFLRREVPRIERSPAFGTNGLILITWDEGSDPPLDPHHVLTLALGPGVRPGVYGGRRYTHYGLLRTLEDGFALRPLGAAARANPINGIWR